jgi:MFS family permease
MVGRSVPGRVLPSFLAAYIGMYNTLIPCIYCCGVLAFALIGSVTLASIVALAVLIGFFPGALLSLVPGIIVQISPDRSVIGNRMGMAFVGISLATLIGPPVSGTLVDNHGLSCSVRLCWGDNDWCGQHFSSITSLFWWLKNNEEDLGGGIPSVLGSQDTIPKDAMRLYVQIEILVHYRKAQRVQSPRDSSSPRLPSLNQALSMRKLRLNLRCSSTSSLALTFLPTLGALSKFTCTNVLAPWKNWPSFG